MITRSPDLRLVYDDRAKEEKDKSAFRIDALAEGRAEGLEQGRSEGVLIGKVQLLTKILSLDEIPKNQLIAMDVADLQSLADDLQKQFEQRG